MNHLKMTVKLLLDLHYRRPRYTESRAAKLCLEHEIALRIGIEAS